MDDGEVIGEPLDYLDAAVELHKLRREEQLSGNFDNRKSSIDANSKRCGGGEMTVEKLGVPNREVCLFSVPKCTSSGFDFKSCFWAFFPKKVKSVKSTLAFFAHLMTNDATTSRCHELSLLQRSRLALRCNFFNSPFLEESLKFFCFLRAPSVPKNSIMSKKAKIASKGCTKKQDLSNKQAFFWPPEKKNSSFEKTQAYFQKKNSRSFAKTLNSANSASFFH